MKRGASFEGASLRSELLNECYREYTTEFRQPIKQSKMDKRGSDNRATQMNPNHAATGPGRPSGYGGQGGKADLNNHSNQGNPNHAKSGPTARK